MVDNVGDRVMLPERVVISRRKRSSSFSLSPVMLLAINTNRFMWLLCHKICIALLLCQKTKSLGNTDVDICIDDAVIDIKFSWQ